MANSLPPVALLLTIMMICEACKIEVRIRSRTNKPFQFELHIPHRNLHVEPWLFTKQWEQRKVLIEEKNCFASPWVMRVNKVQGDRFIEQKNLTAQLDGEGFIRVEVGDDYQPWLNDRHGVFCGHGECGK